ncbi:hypothetical protein MMC15_003600 [Xylographa vitiligo]|nr:hypothetical protein [Xylographa vitiligo]
MSLYLIIWLVAFHQPLLSIFLKAYAVLETFTQTVDEGTLTDAMEVGTLVSAETLIGPTTYVVTVTKVYDNPAFGALLAGFDSADPQCFQQVTDNGQSAVVGHTVTLKTQVDILSEGETLTKECIDGIIGYTNTERMYTFTTAETAYCTFGQFLAAYDNDQDELYLAPGDRCGGSCGHCELYFPEVNVYYWPPASANTACLTTNSATTITPGNSRHGLHANLRALSDVPEGVTTVVNSNGLHYAQCLPASLSDLTIRYTVVGSNGEYNPVISPPADLTPLDPKRNVNCQGAAFQGVDPPHALVPQSVLRPDPTPVSPVVTSKPASPGSGIAAMPVQTAIPKTSALFSPQTAVDPGMDPQQSLSTAQLVPSDPPGSFDPPVTVVLGWGVGVGVLGRGGCADGEGGRREDVDHACETGSLNAQLQSESKFCVYKLDGFIIIESNSDIIFCIFSRGGPAA